MKVREIIDFLDKVADAVNEIGDLGGGLGLPILGKVGGIADTALEIAKNVLDRVDDGKLVLGETDQAKLDAAIEKLAAINDELNAQIVAS